MKRLSTLLTGIAGVALFAMMVLTFADVFARKFLPNSVRGSVELTELLMLVMIFVALPMVSRAGEHIVFDLFDRMLPAAWLRWQKRIAHTVAAPPNSSAQRTASVGDITSALEIRLAPFHFVAAAMLALTALVHLWLVWRVDPDAPSSGDETRRP